jgi:plastocyanin
MSGSNLSSRTTLLSRSLITVLAVVACAGAATHVIQFGGGVGLNYVPNTLNVTVGDVVQWQGDFSMHPLSSVSVPVGAATWHNGAGTSFSYTVTVAGAYHYQCDIHGSLGMTGSFTAAGTGVQSRATPATALPVARTATRAVYDLAGRQVPVPLTGLKGAGAYAYQPVGNGHVYAVQFLAR